MFPFVVSVGCYKQHNSNESDSKGSHCCYSKKAKEQTNKQKFLSPKKQNEQVNTQESSYRFARPFST